MNTYRFPLAQILEQDSHWEKAQPPMQELLKGDPNNLVLLSYFVEQLLVRKQADAAKPWLDQMARTAGQDERNRGIAEIRSGHALNVVRRRRGDCR